METLELDLKYLEILQIGCLKTLFENWWWLSIEYRVLVLELCHKSGPMLGVGLLGDENSDDTSTSLVAMATLSHQV